MTVLQDKGAEERRQWPRYPLGSGGSFRLISDGQVHQCRLGDISLGGASLRLDGAVPRSLEIRIEHARFGSAYARRCWSDRNGMGVAFDHSDRSLDFIARCLLDRAAAMLSEAPA